MCDPEAIAVGEADGARERVAALEVALLLIAGQLVALLLGRLQDATKLGELRERERVLTRGQVLLQLVEHVVGCGHVRENRDPVRDLCALDANGRLELFLLAHDVVRRHLAEVAREHGVAAALLDLAIANGRQLLHGRCRKKFGGCMLGRLELEVLFEDDLGLCRVGYLRRLGLFHERSGLLFSCKSRGRAVCAGFRHGGSLLLQFRRRSGSGETGGSESRRSCGGGDFGASVFDNGARCASYRRASTATA